MLKDPIYKEYKIFITLNIVIFMSIITFLIYFSPFGYYSLMTSTAVFAVGTSRYIVASGLILITIIADMIYLKYYHKKKK